MTGFRVAYGGAQSLLGIRPDLTTLGKIIGGGLPVGAYGGRADMMDHVLPAGKVFQAGTLSGNPLATAAGIATLKVLRDTDPYPLLERLSARLARGLEAAAERSGVPFHIGRCGSMMTLFFSEGAGEGLGHGVALRRQALRPIFLGHDATGASTCRAASTRRCSFPPPTREDDIDATIAAAGEVLADERGVYSCSRRLTRGKSFVFRFFLLIGSLFLPPCLPSIPARAEPCRCDRQRPGSRALRPDILRRGIVRTGARSSPASRE